ncbi:Exonuclease 3'-5' domain-containing protein 1 [Dirofilaria immitis]|nr:Exonuclease 3'-5' domain-containing protein 1 [Dirofilaria immitis]
MDEAKNMALLFFMDHLMQKNGRRTIHDLSCQFGARGFTAEMRDAVGTTQEGLTDFLSQHPSLFTVEGDQVCLNGFGDMTVKNNPLLQATANARNRDYVKEAVQFFETKLQKFGPELQECLIKSLLGHRSQAAPEVRLVSGRHLKDFCEFLQSQSDHFVVEGDRVRLKNMPEPSNAGIELDDEGKPLAGIKAKQAAVEYLRSIVEQNDEQPIPMDAFYQKFCDRFSHTIRQEVATNPKELLQFLKLNRNVFFIRSNKVSLVKNRASEDGSESGSTESSEFENNSSHLNHNAISRINLVKALKPAQESVSLVNAEIDSMEERVVGVDFKTVTLGVQGEEFLSLVILATTTQIIAFDVVHSDTILLESGVKEILESEKIIKGSFLINTNWYHGDRTPDLSMRTDYTTLEVIHDAKRVATLLAHRYAINLRKIFDTQVAHAILQHEKFGKALTDMRTLSFLNLQRVYYPQSIMMSDATPRKLTQSPSWGLRPITEDFLVTVVEEAHCLVTVLYRMMNGMLPKHMLTLFEEKCLKALIPNANRPPPAVLQPNGTTSFRPTRRGIAAPTVNNITIPNVPSPRQVSDASTQTFSTGEINVLSVYYDN